MPIYLTYPKHATSGAATRVTRALRTAMRKREGLKVLIKSRDPKPVRYAGFTRAKKTAGSANRTLTFFRPCVFCISQNHETHQTQITCVCVCALRKQIRSPKIKVEIVANRFRIKIKRKVSLKIKPHQNRKTDMSKRFASESQQTTTASATAFSAFKIICLFVSL